MDKKIKRLTVYRTNLVLNSAADDEPSLKEFIVSESHYEPVFGKLLKETQYNESGQVDQVMAYSYNENGFVTSEELLEADGSILEKKTWQPGTEGRIAREFVHYADGSADRIEYEYDEMGRVIKKVRFDEDDLIESVELFDYEADRLSREALLGSKGEMLAETIFTFNESGKVHELISNNAEEDIWVRKVYRYNEAGQPVSVTTFNKHGEPVARITYENDELGRPRQITEENRRQKNTVEMEYNERGEIIFQEEKDLNGEVTNRIERIYDSGGFLAESQILVRNFQQGISRQYTLRNEYFFFD